MQKSLLIAGTSLLIIILAGTLGLYWQGKISLVSPAWSLIDCFYMTIITLTTVGFGEIIDLASVPGARLFTVFILICGLGISAYFLSTLTAFLVEGDLKNIFWRKKMMKEVNRLSGHTIICGAGKIGRYIMAEFIASKKTFVMINDNENTIFKLQEKYGDFPAVVGDATHDAVLRDAGLDRAAGIITALDDDKDNLCVVVTCKKLNPDIHIISRCDDQEFASKLELLGAEVVVPNFIGGLRMASQMIRPRIVHYLDKMLRDKDYIVRIEEVLVPEHSALVGQSIGSIDFAGFGNLLLLAVMGPGRGFPVYNPDRSYLIGSGDTLVFQAFDDAISRFREKYS